MQGTAQNAANTAAVLPISLVGTTFTLNAVSAVYLHWQPSSVYKLFKRYRGSRVTWKVGTVYYTSAGHLQKGHLIGII